MLAVRISKELEARLERLATHADRSKSYCVKKALEKYLEAEEERIVGEKAYEAYLKSDKNTTSFEEVMERNGL